MSRGATELQRGFPPPYTHPPQSSTELEGALLRAKTRRKNSVAPTGCVCACYCDMRSRVCVWRSAVVCLRVYLSGEGGGGRVRGREVKVRDSLKAQPAPPGLGAKLVLLLAKPKKRGRHWPTLAPGLRSRDVSASRNRVSSLCLRVLHHLSPSLRFAAFRLGQVR